MYISFGFFGIFLLVRCYGHNAYGNKPVRLSLYCGYANPNDYGNNDNAYGSCDNKPLYTIPSKCRYKGDRFDNRKIYFGGIPPTERNRS